MALDPKTLKVEKKAFYVPPLEEIAEVLNSALKSSFNEVAVEVVECPNLKEKPFTLANKGLQGKPRLIEIGGPVHLLPLPQLEKVYDLKDIKKLTDLETATIIGATGGPFMVTKVNCEGIINIKIDDAGVDQQSRIAKVSLLDGSPIQELLPNDETRVVLLANLFASEGKPGKVLKVHVKNRIGSDDFIASIRKALAHHYEDKIVGLGGTFLLKQGKAKQHIMPDFSKVPLNDDNDLNGWLKFYNMSAPLIAVGTLATGEHDLDLRVQHFHSFSHHGEAGHYHIDTTPETVEYLGYFNTAEFIYRIDQPTVVHKIGRD